MGMARQVEELYAEHIANRSKSRSLASRLVSTGFFTYRINLDNMTQENAVTGKTRHIRRANSVSSMSLAPMVAGRLARGGSSMSTIPGTIVKAKSMVLPEDTARVNSSS